MDRPSEYIACSSCFTDEGLKLVAESLGESAADDCPNCSATEGAQLTKGVLIDMAHRFFVWGSFNRVEYGGAPLIQFNDKHASGEVQFPYPLSSDVALIEKLCGVGFFHYGPRLWMLGEIEPLLQLQKSSTRTKVVGRILDEYPSVYLEPGGHFYRVRKAPVKPNSHAEYDSPPAGVAGNGRLDAQDFSVLYASPDIEVCVHECRFTAEDELYVATLNATRPLRLLNLTALPEEDGTEFESLDISLNMLFLAGKYSYDIAREIAMAARSVGFDGLIYPSYFSELRTGVMPLRTTYGISNRRILQYQQMEQSLSVPNYAIFGHPVEEGLIAVQCINKMVISRVEYGFHFGPVGI
ncbi:MAG: RES family NAD+ phosphorylase [Candidatus Sedimenticola sp. (ex Thyasira tokunagai)]